jgi:hypothetical protein
MRRLCIATLIAALAASATSPTEIKLAITKKVPLNGELEDLVTFGLLEEMSCDSDGNIFSPSTRKYSSANNAVVRFTHDATSYTKFSIDALTHLSGGTIIDFDLEPSGELYVLARQVLKYSEVEVPMEFGEDFLIRYNKSGKALSQLQLKVDTDNFSPTGLAVLSSGEFLVVGYRLAEGKTFMIAESFQHDGNLKARFELGHGGTRTSNGKTVSSPRVFHPVAVKANGLIYVMRGSTTEPIYVLSEAGQLLKTIQLKPLGLEFDSPKIMGNNLIVREHPPFSDEETGIRIRTGPQRVNLPLFSLESGDIADEYYWHEETFGLACYTSESLTFIGQDLSAMPPGWAIFEAKPASPAKSRGIVTGR